MSYDVKLELFCNYVKDGELCNMDRAHYISPHMISFSISIISFNKYDKIFDKFDNFFNKYDKFFNNYDKFLISMISF